MSLRKKSSQFNLAEAKAHFSDLVRKAMAGEEVIIAKDNRPVLRLVPLKHQRSARQPGSAKGKIWIAPDFDETPKDFVEYV